MVFRLNRSLNVYQKAMTGRVACEVRAREGMPWLKASLAKLQAKTALERRTENLSKFSRFSRVKGFEEGQDVMSG